MTPMPAPNSELSVRDLLDALQRLQTHQAKFYAQMAEHGQMLKQINEKVADLASYQRQLNGTVRDHAVWIAANSATIERTAEQTEQVSERLADVEAFNAARRETLKEFEQIKATVQQHQNTLQQSEGARVQSKKDWAVSVAIVGTGAGLLSTVLGLLAKALFHL